MNQRSVAMALPFFASGSLSSGFSFDRLRGGEAGEEEFELFESEFDPGSMT